ncbi:hypothetical protein AB0B45_49820 [Nonomuraea sp. NPDC049152]|uniref:hypothetical protein n=1 Tax=Nonomuraea sp. NPDC049152 TaxID=3154350 RepID=UPI0033D9EE5F
MLWQVFLTKEADFFFVPGNEGLEVFIDVTYPGWYEPVRAVLLVLGSFAQILGLILLTGKHGVAWSAGHQKKQHIDPVSPPLWAHPPRQAALLMLLTPAFLLLYAGVNWGGCCSARLDPFPQPFLLDMQAHLEYLVVPAVPVVVAGLILHLSRARAQVWIGLVVGSVGLPYTLSLFESATHHSDTSVFHSGVAEQLEGTAWWDQHAIMTAGIAILLLHLASVALLFRIDPPVSAALDEP